MKRFDGKVTTGRLEVHDVSQLTIWVNKNSLGDVAEATSEVYRILMLTKQDDLLAMLDLESEDKDVQ
jgi:hypothetical protein